jgi:hypothetical protein
MKPKWLKVWKKFRGGVSKPDYLMMHPDDDKEETAEIWATKAPGGHSYGWTVYWKSVDAPPIEWIDNEIEGLERQMKAIDSHIVTYKKEKEIILKKIEVNETKIEIHSLIKTE